MTDLPGFFYSDWVKFFEVSYDGIIIADGEGRIVYMNPASERLEEVSKDYIIGKYAADLEAEGVYEVSATVMVLRERRAVTIMQYLGGKKLVITGIPIFEGDRIKWVYINERDVTELMQVKGDSVREKKRAGSYRTRLDGVRKAGVIEEELIASSLEMRKIMDLLGRVSPTDITVLLEGESGVGKGALAGRIHATSRRADKPFFKIDCGALPESLLETELFGYEKGAFTGASTEGKPGLVEAAEGGTLFLDEIGELSLGLQVKLLRLLQEQVFMPVGGIREKKVDIRVIAATNRDLQSMVAEGGFRSDLYYRLSVLPIRIPPLRERADDIFPFIRHYLLLYNTKYYFRKQVSHAAVNALCRYAWPGNVRELSNVMEHLVLVTPKGVIEAEDVDAVLNPAATTDDGRQANVDGMAYEAAMDCFEKNYLQKAMERGGTVARTAADLGISESTLKRRLRKHKLRLSDQPGQE